MTCSAAGAHNCGRQLKLPTQTSSFEHLGVKTLRRPPAGPADVFELDRPSTCPSRLTITSKIAGL